MPGPLQFPILQTTDSHVDIDEIATPSLKPAVLCDFAPGSLHERSVGEALRARLAIPFIGQPEIWAVSRIARAGATTTGLSAPPYQRPDRARPEVIDLRESFQQKRSTAFEVVQDLLHRGLPIVQMPLAIARA
jgi:hypothetical protein